MKITIVGGGNIGTQYAVHCAEKKHSVWIYSSKPERFSKELEIVNQAGEVTHKGVITQATSNPKEAFEQADVIFITVPAFMQKETAEVIFPYIRSGVKIGLIPGTGGGECAFQKCMKKGAVLFGMQRVPSVARLIKYGKTVCATGYRNQLFISSLPKRFGEECAEFIQTIFEIPCAVLPDYLNLTLTPSNPILHTTRLRTLFEGYEEGVQYDNIPLFYEEWSDETSRLLFRCDEEVQRVCQSLTMFNLSEVKSLRVHYESETPDALTRKIRSIEGFKGLATPSICLENGKYIPDLQSRYFTSDFSYGLAILKQVAQFSDVETPNIDETLAWYEKVKISEIKDFRFEDYGICTFEDFREFYKQ